MSTPKRHHYVPQFLLHNFTDENGDLHFFTEKNKCREVLKAKPDNVFHQKHLYTSINDDGSKDTTLETEYADLEGKASGLIARLIKQVRNESTPAFSEEDHELWNLFFYNQWRRVPDMHDAYFNDNEFFDAIAQEASKKDFPPEYFEFLEALEQNPELKEKIKQNAKVQVLSTDGDRVLNFMKSLGLGIAHIKKPNKSFVIGSLPIIKLTQGTRTHILDAGNEIWFPIAHDVAVCSTVDAPKEIVIIEPTDEDIRYIVEASYRQSTAVAGKSPKLIASIANIKTKK